MKDELSKADFRKEVYTSHGKFRKKFKSRFLSQINEFIEEIFKTYEVFEIADGKCKGDKQKSHVVGYLFNAINNLVVSVNLLVSGYIVSSGNLMRHYTESVAIAILIANRKLRFFEKLMSGEDSMHNPVGLISKNIGNLKIRREGFAEFNKIYKFYHNYSHPSPLAVADMFNFADTNKSEVYIGNHYDSTKDAAYTKEIKIRIGATKSLRNVIQGITKEHF